MSILKKTYIIFEGLTPSERLFISTLARIQLTTNSQEIHISDKELSRLTFTSMNYFRKMRLRLKEKGLISFISGQNRQSTVYKLDCEKEKEESKEEIFAELLSKESNKNLDLEYHWKDFVQYYTSKKFAIVPSKFLLWMQNEAKPRYKEEKIDDPYKTKSETDEEFYKRIYANAAGTL